jgi:uncharacterized protein (TIGR02444 family)
MSVEESTVAPEETPFWRFSGTVYAHPGVAEACLSLQERHHLDVNLLLFCAWAGSRGHRLDGGELGQLRSLARPWHDQVVAPLRATRRWLKVQTSVPDSLGEAFREEVKSLELQAEMLEQLMLYQEIEIAEAPDKEGGGTPDDVAANLRLYLTRMKPLPSDDDIANLAAVLCGTCPDVKPVHAIRILEG